MDNLTVIKEKKTSSKFAAKFQSKTPNKFLRIHPFLNLKNLCFLPNSKLAILFIRHLRLKFSLKSRQSKISKCYTNSCIHIYIYTHSQAYRRGARSKQELTGWHRDQQCGSVCQCCSWQRGWLPRCCYVVSVVLSTGKGAHASPTNPILPTGRSKRTWSSPGDRSRLNKWYLRPFRHIHRFLPFFLLTLVHPPSSA